MVIQCGIGLPGCLGDMVGRGAPWPGRGAPANEVSILISTSVSLSAEQNCACANSVWGCASWVSAKCGLSRGSATLWNNHDGGLRVGEVGSP